MSRLLVLGLTGSIGMGKTTVAGMFAEAGVPVFDADAEVHRLYAGDAVEPVSKAFPGVAPEGVVDRARLAHQVFGDAQALRRLEAIVHPLVGKVRDRFLDEARRAGVKIALVDVPLLFETGRDADVDRVVVVSAPESVQKTRVMARPGMTEAKFSAILRKQMPDDEKRRRADFVIDTGGSLDVTRHGVRRVLAAMAGGSTPAEF